jgi:hypothetical protein
MLRINGILDYSLRSPFGPPFGRSTRYALLSGFRRNDENGINQTSVAIILSFVKLKSQDFSIGHLECPQLRIKHANQVVFKR